MNANNDPGDVFNHESNVLARAQVIPRWVVQAVRPRVAVLKSGLLHLRQLADILLSRGTRLDDINLQDLVANYLPALLEDLRREYGTLQAGRP